MNLYWLALINAVVVGLLTYTVLTVHSKIKFGREARMRLIKVGVTIALAGDRDWIIDGWRKDRYWGRYVVSAFERTRARMKIGGESCDRGPCCLSGGHEGGCDQ